MPDCFEGLLVFEIFGSRQRFPSRSLDFYSPQLYNSHT